MPAKLIALLAILIVPICVTAQQPCSKTLSEAPSISGLRLGMPISELPTVIGPTIKFKPAKSGEGSFFQNFVEQEPPPKLAGTRALYVRYFSGKVYQIEIFFEDKDQTSKVEDFTKQLSADYQLPLDVWIIKNNRAEMDCDGFTITADAILNRHIELTDEEAYKAFQAKQQQKKKPSKKKKN